MVPSNRTRDNGQRPLRRKFDLKMRMDFFSVQVTKHWNGLTREVVESSSLEIPSGCSPVQRVVSCLCLGRELGPDDLLFAPGVS